MSLDHILLGLLDRPATGYELKAEFGSTIRGFWSAELSQIYPSLKRLEARGLLSSHTEPPTRGPARRVYTRTEAGTDELARWLRDEPKVGTERFAYLAQLFFMGELDDLTETRQFLVRLRRRLAGWHDELRQVERDMRDAHGDAPERYPTDGLHHFAALRMGIHSIGAKVNWCDETIATIDARLGATDHPTPEPQKEDA